MSTKQPTPRQMAPGGLTLDMLLDDPSWGTGQNRIGFGDEEYEGFMIAKRREEEQAQRTQLQATPPQSPAKPVGPAQS